MKCALVMSGGLAKGAFQAGVVKSFAANKLVPDVVVGASAGALNAGMTTKLIAEGTFTPEIIQEQVANVWVNETSLLSLWGGEGDIRKKDSIRNIFGDIHANPFMLIRRLSNLQLDVWARLRILFSLSFLSVFNNEPICGILEKYIKAPKVIARDVTFAVTLTDLFAHTEYILGKPINNYSEYATFKFSKGETENLEKKFKQLRAVVQASGSFPGMFPPSELEINGKSKKLYVDGGVTKNAPFGRAIKLDHDIQYIFLVTTAPITKPIMNEIRNFPDVVGQVYEIIVTKDIASDYRKVAQINKRIELLSKMLERDKNDKVIENERNNDLSRLAGFQDLNDYFSKRWVEIIFIEPERALEGDPFAAIYRKDRKYLLESYIKHGYDVGNKVIKEFLEKVQKKGTSTDIDLPA